MSTFSEKFVDFEIAVENESKAQLPSKQGSSPEQTSVLEEAVYKISSQLSTMSRNQKYFRTRENRNFSTVHSTEKRIVNFSMIQIGMVIAMAALQVVVVRFFFQVRSVTPDCFRTGFTDTPFLGRTQGLRLNVCFVGSDGVCGTIH